MNRKLNKSTNRQLNPLAPPTFPPTLAIKTKIPRANQSRTARKNKYAVIHTRASAHTRTHVRTHARARVKLGGVYFHSVMTAIREEINRSFALLILYLM